MPISKAGAYWEGDLKSGRGNMNVASGKFDSDFSAGARFEGKPGTNPEELIGAAYAGCFSMALSNMLDQAGHTPKRIQTSAKVHMEKDADGFSITLIELETQGKVPGISEEAFREHANEAKDNCPVSKALTGVEKQITATLE